MLTRRNFMAAGAVCAWGQQAPDDVSAGRAEVLAGRFAKAAQMLEKTATPEGVYWRVRALLRNGKRLHAIREAAAGMEKWPETTWANAASGMAHMRKGDLIEAERRFQAATRLSEKFPYGYMGFAGILSLVSRRRSARTTVRQAYALAESDPALIMAMAMTVDNYDEHVRLLERAASLTDPGTEDGIGLAGHIESDKHLGAGPFSVLKSPYGEYEIALQPTYSNTEEGLGVPVRFDGGKPVLLLLDTGASGLVVYKSEAKRAGLQLEEGARSGLARGVGSDKAKRGWVVVPKEFAAGDLRTENPMVRVVDAETREKAAGLIGTDYFSGFHVEVDYPGRKLRLRPHAGRTQPRSDQELLEVTEPPPEGYARFLSSGHMMLIPAALNQHPRRAYFLIDSGAQMNLVSREFGEEATVLRPETRTRVRGIQGDVQQVFRAERVELIFGGFRQTNGSLLSFDMEDLSRGVGLELGGVLGMPVLRRMRLHIDYERAAVRFEYRG